MVNISSARLGELGTKYFVRVTMNGLESPGMPYTEFRIIYSVGIAQQPKHYYNYKNMGIEGSFLTKQFPHRDEVPCVPGKTHTEDGAKFFGVFHELGIFHPSFVCPHCHKKFLDEDTTVH